MECIFQQITQNNKKKKQSINQLNQIPIQQLYSSLLNLYSNPSSPYSPNDGKSQNLNNDKYTNNDKFSLSINSFVSYAESKSGSLFTFTDICNTFNIQKRRLYDVINALESIGCCKKTSVDTIVWKGLKFIPECIRNLFLMYHFEQPNADIDILISNESSISILQLAQSFVLLFIVLQRQVLNIKTVASFLSKRNGRFKTTLCKLYQIAHIFETLKIFRKSANTGQVIIMKPYYFEINYQGFSSIPPQLIDESDNIKVEKNKESNPLSIQNLLSRPKNSVCSSNSTIINVIEMRNRKFELSDYKTNFDT